VADPVDAGRLSRLVWRRVNARAQLGLAAGVVAGLLGSVLLSERGAGWLSAPAALALALVGWAAGLALLVPGRLRRAAEALLWTSFESRDRARSELGEGFVPAGPREAALWLRRHPLEPRTARHRVAALLMAGDLDAARREADALPEPTPLAAFEAEVARGVVALAAGRAPDLAAAMARAGSLTDPADRDHAERALLSMEAMRAVAERRDPLPVLGKLRAQLGERARGILWTRYWLPLAAVLSAVAVLIWAVLALAGPLLLR
jgi:hypothetical protein